MKFDDIFSRVDTILYTNVTDRQTDTGRQQRPRLCVRGKNAHIRYEILSTWLF